MNTRIKAEKDILGFLKSDKQVMVISGTNMYKKHELVLESLVQHEEKTSVILFRGDSESNFSKIFNDFSIRIKIGTRYSLDKHRLYVDSMDEGTWDSSPGRIDVAVIYPLVFSNADEVDRCINDLVSRSAKKIIFVTGEDSNNLDWLNNYNPEYTVYDAEEEIDD